MQSFRALPTLAAVLLTTVAVTGCSSSEPSSTESVPTSTPRVSASPSPKASPTPSATPTETPTEAPVTAASLSDPATGYTVVAIPEGLDQTQIQAMQGFVAFDRATWEAYRVMDGDLSAVEATTVGNELARYQETYNTDAAAGVHLEGSSSVTIMSVDVDPSMTTATVGACLDQTAMSKVSSTGEDLTPEGLTHRYQVSYSLENTTGTWVVADSEVLGTDQC